MNSLESLRNEIDTIDKQLVHLIEKRTAIAANIGKVKRHHQKEVFDCQRESEVLKSIKQYAKESIVQKHLEKIYKEIMILAKAIQ